MDNEDIFEQDENVIIPNYQALIEKEKQLAHLELLKLTRTRMKKSNLLDDVIEQALTILNSRLNPENPEDVDNISINTLTFIIKEFSKAQSELLAGILGATKTNKISIDEKPSSGSEPKTIIPISKTDEISQEEFQTAKNVLNFINKIKHIKSAQSEFPEVEQNEQAE